MNASVRQTSLEIHTRSAKSAQVPNVNAKHHINSLVEIVYWPVVKTADNAHQELNVFRLLAV